MDHKTPHVSRRAIGKVNIFDISGTLEDSDLVSAVQAYIRNYIKECHFANVIVNIQSVETASPTMTHSILQILETPKKSAVYADTKDMLDSFMAGYAHKRIHQCATHGQILSLFGRELLERDKEITFEERRSAKRLKSALYSKIDFIDKEDKVINSEAIITNLSSDGLFAEYLDIKSAFTMNNLEYFKNLTVRVQLQNTECGVAKELEYFGSILRIEFSGNQAGIAIKFKSNVSE
jgi:hypothetical protein